MNEVKRLILILATILSIVVCILGFMYFDDLKTRKTYDVFKEALNRKENTLIYIGSPICSYCQLLNPSLEDMKQRYDFDYVYINVNELNDKYKNKIVETLNIKTMGTPLLAVVSNGNVIDVQESYQDYNVTFGFLQKNNIISNDKKLLLNYINIEKYNEIIKEKDKNIIAIGEAIGTDSVNARIVLNEIASKNNIKINYLSIRKNSEYTELLSSFKDFENGVTLPIIVIVKNGKIIDTLENIATEEQYIEFFEENGVI